MIELWKDIENFNGLYQISNFGNVKSMPKMVIFSNGRKRHYDELILKLRKDGKGYNFVTLYKKDFNIQVRVHRLVAEAFIINHNNSPCVNHKNGIRTDNNIENLEWCTHSENTLDGIKRGTINNPSKKISIEDAVKIRDIYSSTAHTQKEVGEMFGLTQSQIHRIVNNISWKI